MNSGSYLKDEDKKLLNELRGNKEDERNNSRDGKYKLDRNVRPNNVLAYVVFACTIYWASNVCNILLHNI